jgi:hypothetical protein
MENSNDIIGNWTRDLPVCSAVPQPTALPAAWPQTTKGQTTKEYFPIVADRLNMKINITHNFTTMVTGHGNVRSYLHRFKILDTPTCSCGTKGQTVDHLVCECELLKKERESSRSTVLQTDTWPVSKETLIRKHFKIFVQFINEISFHKLNLYPAIVENWASS